MNIKVKLNKNGVWIAHCLDYDLISSGTTKRTAIEKLGICIEEYEKFSDAIGADPTFRSPDEYWDE